MYPITSVFRTEGGIVPGYGLVPAHPGRYEFPAPLLLMSERTLHSVTYAEVVGPAASVVVSTRRGAIGVHEDLYQGQPIFSIDNMPLRLLEPTKSNMEDTQVLNMAFRAAFTLAAKRLQEVNRLIRELVFLEFRSKPVSVSEYTNSLLYIMDFSKLSTKHIHMWFYHFLVCMFRTGGLRMPRLDNVVTLNMQHVWWRDMVLVLLKHFNVDFSVRFTPGYTRVTFSRAEFRRMLARVLRVRFPRLVDDFAFVDAVTNKDIVILDSNGIVEITETADEPGKVTRTKMRGKYTEYIGMHITFPEIPGFVEINGLIL